MLFTKSLFALAGSVAMAAGASLQKVNSFGDNLSNIDMFIYVPDKLAAKPPVIVAMHVCGGSAQEWFGDNNLHTYADSQGFIIIYPQTTHMSNCWDVNNKASLTHNGGGDAGTIVNMVKYTLQKYSGDASRVFAMGGSSGAMMTNVMLGSYPDVFAAGAAYSGIPFACALGDANATPSSSNQTCAQGQIQKTAAQWGDFVRNAYPGYTGKRPSMAVFHGLADSLVRPACAQQQMDQWSNVLGLSMTKKVSGVPSSQYTQYVYGNGSQLVGYLGQGVGHWAPVNNPVMLKFFGILS